MTSLIFAINEDWNNWHKENPWAAFVPEFAEDENGQRFMKPLGRPIIYKVIKELGNGGEKYQCNDCKLDIRVTTVAHSIWDGPFPCSGSGEVYSEQVPYCPTCEEKPSSSGIPISVN